MTHTLPNDKPVTAGPDSPSLIDTTPRWRTALSVRNISAVYLLIAMLILYSLWVPDTFLTQTTVLAILNDQAIVLIASLAVLVPLAAGVFDLSIGGAIGLAAVVVAKMNATYDLPAWVSVGIALGIGCLVGLVNGFLVVRLKVDSFMATLAMSSVLAGIILWVTSSQQIIGLSASLRNLAQAKLLGIAMPVWYALIFAFALWFFLERTTIGRYLFATGGSVTGARLAGVATSRYIFGSFVFSAVAASFAGILVTSKVGAGSLEIGPSYLLPAYAGAFFGATQLKRGRFNVWGTVIAVYTLAVGVKGLQLAQVGIWVNNVFNGVILATAVALSVRQTRVRRAKAPRRQGTRQ